MMGLYPLTKRGARIALSRVIERKRMEAVMDAWFEHIAVCDGCSEGDVKGTGGVLQK